MAYLDIAKRVINNTPGQSTQDSANLKQNDSLGKHQLFNEKNENNEKTTQPRIDNALDLFAELHALHLSPEIVNGQLVCSSPIPEYLFGAMRRFGSGVFALIAQIDSKIPGQCERCNRDAEDRFKVHVGMVCIDCLGELMSEASTDGEEAQRACTA